MVKRTKKRPRDTQTKKRKKNKLYEKGKTRLISITELYGSTHAVLITLNA